MGERIEPLLALTVEGKGWCGDEDFVRSRTPAEVHLDPESEREVAELLRAMLAKRLEFLTGMAALKVDALDFTSPALPTRPELEGIVAALDTASEVAAALREMSPEDFRDDDDEDPEPEPDPVEPVTAQPSQEGDS